MNVTARSSFDLAGRTALITGGARGIGYVTAAMLAAAGARVVIVDINDDLLAGSVGNLRSVGHEVVRMALRHHGRGRCRRHRRAGQG